MFGQDSRVFTDPRQVRQLAAPATGFPALLTVPADNPAPFRENPAGLGISPHQGENPWPYPPSAPSYGAPGPIGLRDNIALAFGLKVANAEAATHPGLIGASGINGQGRERGSVSYDVYSPMLYARPQAQKQVEWAEILGIY